MHWKWLSEFRDFALKGNVVDLAVGVIIGAAFGKIVSALVENVLMPPIGFLLKGVDFKDLAINMGTAQTPVLIGSAGTAGADTHVDWVLEIVEEIASELGRPLRGFAIYAEQQTSDL